MKTERTKQIEKLYYEKLKTMEEIGKCLGITKQAVSIHIRKDKHQNFKRPSKKVPFDCPICGKRKYFYKHQLITRKLTCSFKCRSKLYNFTKIRQNLDKKITVNSTRIARKTMNAMSGQVVHHIDGNPLNNNKENLMLFNSHSEHMKYHYKKFLDIEPSM